MLSFFQELFQTSYVSCVTVSEFAKISWIITRLDLFAGCCVRRLYIDCTMAMFTMSADYVPTFLAAQPARRVYLVSITPAVAQSVRAGVAAHGNVVHEHLSIADGEAMPPLVHAEVTRLRDVIVAHMAAGGVVGVHCRLGVSRSTSFMASFLRQTQGATATLADISATVSAQRCPPNTGVAWRPAPAAIAFFREQEWALATGHGRDVTFGFGENASQQARFLRAKRR